MMKQKTKYLSRILGRWAVGIWLLALIIPRESFAQSDTIPLPALAYPLLQPGADTLQQPEALAPFFALLDSLRTGKDTVVTIVHLGDSHIQAGHYSGRVIRLLQQEFGNAGRGWIAPFKLSRTNEPDDYFINSAVQQKNWTAGRCIQRERRAPIGLGGIGIKTLSPSVNLDVIIAPHNGAGYSFNEVILYRGDRSMPMLPTGPHKAEVSVTLADSALLPGLKADTFRLQALADTLQLHSTRRKQGTDQLLPASSFQNIYFGFNLLNGQSGILYHSIGVNGAMYVNYTDSAYLQQLALLKPALLIISLGTNETFGRQFHTEEFTLQVKSFVQLIRHYLPGTVLLLTTPPECYKRVYVNKKRTYVRNAQTLLAAQVLTQVAREEGLACWDLFGATGGKNSCKQWQRHQLMGRDRVHFNKVGYAEQGTLLYRALMRSYQSSHVQ